MGVYNNRMEGEGMEKKGNGNDKDGRSSQGAKKGQEGDCCYKTKEREEKE